jgi:DNA modification methylase
MDHKIICGDSFTVLKTLESESVNCVVTSPPYFGLRKYSNDSHEIGLETNYQDYVNNLRDVFHEVERVLKLDGVFFLNLGDSFSGSGRGQTRDGCMDEKRKKMKGIKLKNSINCGLPAKNLIGIPWRVAFALQEDGWILRSDNIWEKPNAMPDSTKDRPTRSHEYVFMFTKSPKYYYDYESSLEPCVANSDVDYRRTLWRKNAATYNLKVSYKNNFPKKFRMDGMRNMRTVWSIPTKGYAGDHPAVFPVELPSRCIKIGCPRGGMVLDPFCGSGTVVFACEKLGVNFLGIELNQKYVDLAMERMNHSQTLGF